MVERLPSSTYWNGLWVLGIRRVDRPLSAYCRWLDDPRRLVRVARDDDGVPIEGLVRTWWDSLPAKPEDFPEVATFALSRGEAQYMIGRAAAATPYPTMLAFLFAEGRADANVDLPWKHPQRSSMPALVRDDLDVAEHFSLIHHGAALLYNLLIAEARKDEPRGEHYRARLEAWQNEVGPIVEGFDLARVWLLTGRASTAARRFVQEWCKIVVHGGGHRLSDSRAAKELIRIQEIRVKGTQRSRIANPFRVGWNGASGSAQLDYRWRSSVQQIALDVANGRERA